jgi:hypothetical protein
MRTKNGWDQEVWMRPSSVRAFGKFLARKFRGDYSVAVDAIVRACGFTDFREAVEAPRKVLVPLDVWAQRLEDALGIDLGRVFDGKGLRIQYYKVFTDSTPNSLTTWRTHTLPAIPRERPETGWAPEEEFVPVRVSHEQTLVDEIARDRNPGRRVVRRA